MCISLGLRRSYESVSGRWQTANVPGLRSAVRVSVPNTARDVALAAYRSRHCGCLAGVGNDVIFSVFDKVRAPLRIRRITFRVGTKTLYLVTPDTTVDRRATLIIPGESRVEVIMWHGGQPYARALSNSDGIAVFSPSSPGRSASSTARGMPAVATRESKYRQSGCSLRNQMISVCLGGRKRACPRPPASRGRPPRLLVRWLRHRV